MAERASKRSRGLWNKPSSFKIGRRGLDKLKQQFTKNSESCDNGRVHPDGLRLPVPTPPSATFVNSESCENGRVHPDGLRLPVPTPPSATFVNRESCENGRVHPDILGLPVPAPPPAMSVGTNFHASFPTPMLPSSQGWWTPGRHDQEASGSNHTSNQNSEYFDAVDTSEYVNQHQIPNYSELHGGRQVNRPPRLEDQLACFFEDIRVDTPSTNSHVDRTYHPGNPFAQAFDSELDLLSASYCDPVNEHYSFLDFDDATATSAQQQHGHGTMEQSWFPGCEDATATSTQQQYGHGTMEESWCRGSDGLTQQPSGSCFQGCEDAMATSAQQQCGHETTEQSLFRSSYDATATLAEQQFEYECGHGYGNGHGSMSVATGDSVNGGCSTMDTGSSSPPTSPSSYILQPVAEERPSSMRRAFYSHYMECRRIVRGEETPDRSGRRGRGFRVLGSIICIAIRLKGRLASRMKSQQSAEEEIREPLREQSTKKKRTAACTASASSSTEQRRYKGVAERNGKWHAEVRVSKLCGSKVWAGTYGTQKEAALAADAGHYHCSAKKKKYNFPEHVKDLGPSQYNRVHALFKSGDKDTAQELVKTLMKAHAAKLPFR